MSKQPILVIDDDIEIQRIFKLALQLSGYQVSTVGGGTEALRVLEDLPTPGLIILDLTMPDMDGFEFLEHKAARSAIRDIPVALCTAAGHTPTVSGVAEYLEKPIDFDRLLATVSRFCG